MAESISYKWSFKKWEIYLQCSIKAKTKNEINIFLIAMGSVIFYKFIKIVNTT